MIHALLGAFAASIGWVLGKFVGDLILLVVVPSVVLLGARRAVRRLVRRVVRKQPRGVR